MGHDNGSIFWHWCPVCPFVWPVLFDGVPGSYWDNDFRIPDPVWIIDRLLGQLFVRPAANGQHLLAATDRHVTRLLYHPVRHAGQGHEHMEEDVAQE